MGKQNEYSKGSIKCTTTKTISNMFGDIKINTDNGNDIEDLNISIDSCTMTKEERSHCFANLNTSGELKDALKDIDIIIGTTYRGRPMTYWREIILKAIAIKYGTRLRIAKLISYLSKTDNLNALAARNMSTQEATDEVHRWGVTEEEYHLAIDTSVRIIEKKLSEEA